MTCPPTHGPSLLNRTHSTTPKHGRQQVSVEKPRLVSDGRVQFHNEKMQHVHDAAEEELAALLTVDVDRQASLRVDRVVSEAVEALKRPLPDTPGRWHPTTILPYTLSLRSRLEQEASKVVAEYSPFQCLWYSRRLPPRLLAGTRPSTAGYSSLLADVFTFGAHGTSDETVKDVFITFKLDEHVARRLAMFAELVRRTNQLHVLIRMISKGCDAVLNNTGVPAPRCSAELLAAMSHYDDRLDKAGGFLSRTGVGLETEAVDPREALFGCFAIEPKVLEVPVEFRGADKVKVDSRFMPDFVSVDALHRFNADQRLKGRSWWSPEAIPLALLLSVTGNIAESLATPMVSLCKFGYFVVTRDVFYEIVNESIGDKKRLIQEVFGVTSTPSSPSELLDALGAITGQTWPLKPPGPIRQTSKYIVIDLFCGTARLDAALEFPLADGDVANARADHFEDSVQRVIDDSKWVPSPNMKTLRRKTIRLAGRDITDIDAIGESDGVVIVVSCKSRIYTAAYDAGDYAEVRNASTVVQEAVAHWRGIVQTLTTSPVGDNYDFSGKTLIGVVCTPAIVYVPLGDATSFVADGLRAAVSVEEFSDWLNR